MLLLNQVTIYDKLFIVQFSLTLSNTSRSSSIFYLELPVQPDLVLCEVRAGGHRCLCVHLVRAQRYTAPRSIQNQG